MKKLENGAFAAGIVRQVEDALCRAVEIGDFEQIIQAVALELAGKYLQDIPPAPGDIVVSPSGFVGRLVWDPSRGGEGLWIVSGDGGPHETFVDAEGCRVLFRGLPSPALPVETAKILPFRAG